MTVPPTARYVPGDKVKVFSKAGNRIFDYADFEVTSVMTVRDVGKDPRRVYTVKGRWLQVFPRAGRKKHRAMVLQFPASQLRKVRNNE